MTSMFDYDDSINLAFDAKIAGKKLVTAKHELLTKTGEFLFLAHSDRELASRMQMVEEDIEKVAHRKLSNVSDSKAKLVRAIFDEWQLRHASCSMCKTAAGEWSAMGRATGEGMVCNGGGKGEVLNAHSCGAANPLGGLGAKTGLCMNCEEKLGMKAPGHDYTGKTFNDNTTASKLDLKDAANKNGSKTANMDYRYNPDDLVFQHRPNTHHCEVCQSRDGDPNGGASVSHELHLYDDVDRTTNFSLCRHCSSIASAEQRAGRRVTFSRLQSLIKHETENPT
jgi:hypothetical protein